jgi:uncharacterized membrane protein
MRQYLSLGIAVVVVAIVTHLVSVWALPTVIMSRAINRIGAVGMNQIHFQKRPDETARGIVRPSPDLLYSVCPYDLSVGPLRVRSPVPNDTYWSVSLFDDATNNFYVLNDRQAYAAKQSVVDFLIVPSGANENTEGFKTVASPSTKGLALFRTLIYDDKRLPEIEALRRGATCKTWHASPSDVSSKKS